MDNNVCAQCGVEIEGKGIHYQGHHFCSDECCEEFDVEVVSNSEPEIADLEQAVDPDEDELGYRNKDILAEEADPLDDDYEIHEDDF